MSRKKRRQGHFCWCCGRMGANERFSRRGHMRHVCSDCAKLGQEELAYRQATRDMDQLVDWNGLLRRKQRTVFKRFLAHPDARVRLYAEEVARDDETRRTAMRLDRQAEQALEAEYEREWLNCGDEQGERAPEWVTQTLPIDPTLDELIPVWDVAPGGALPSWRRARSALLGRRGPA